MKKYVSKTIEDTQKIAHEWVQSILTQKNDKKTESDSAFIVGLSGHLGAGKTAFVKCVAKEFGIVADITSPTYVIMKIYSIDVKTVTDKKILCPWKNLVHIDAYRLEKPEEIQALDWENLVANKENLILVEWPENVGLDQKILSQKISFRIEGEGREIEVK